MEQTVFVGLYDQTGRLVLVARGKRYEYRGVMPPMRRRIEALCKKNLVGPVFNALRPYSCVPIG